MTTDVIREPGVIAFETIDPADQPRLRQERVNETRYVRTFTREELLAMLLGDVLREAGRYGYEAERSSIEIVSPAMAENTTVKVTVREYGA